MNKDLLDRLNDVGVDQNLFWSIPSGCRQFIVNCLHYGVSNSVSLPFNKGDIVVLKFDLNNQILTDAYGVPLKWMYDKNVFGLVLGQRILGKTKSGYKLGKLKVINSTRSCSIELDPDYLDSIILNTTYDPLTKKKCIAALKKKAVEYNRSISTYIASEEDAINYINSLSPGDKIWVAKNLIDLTTTPVFFEIIHVSKYANFADVLVRAANGVNLHLKYKVVLDTLVSKVEPFPIENVVGKI